jgi:hypothetical protein
MAQKPAADMDSTHGLQHGAGRRGHMTFRPLFCPVRRMAVASPGMHPYSRCITHPPEHTMRHSFESFSLLLDDTWHALCRAVRYAANAIATMSWPALLITAVLMAFAISLLPLALTLFVLFMLIKLVAGATGIGKRRHDNAAFKD